MRLGFLRVLSVHIEQVPCELGEPRQIICLELLNKNCSGKIALKFTGVHDLKIERVHPGITCGLQIVSVADGQLEGLRFYVFNPEQDFELRFYCFDFEINELPIGELLA